MPAIYAHHRFGAEVAKALDGDLKTIVSEHYTPYQIGLQGPDIFFFYRPWSKNKVSAYGNHLHAVSALPFFEHALRVARKKGRGSASYAYLLGFICHFALDSECHAYVEQMVKETGVQHLEIEAEFDKLLLRMDGQEGASYPAASLVPTDRRTAEALEPFYAKGITIDIAQQSLKDLKLVKRIFRRPGAAGQAVVNTVMKRMGVYEKMNGLMYQRRDNPLCGESSAGLLARYEGAVAVALYLMKQFDRALTGAEALDARFNRNFE